MRTFCFIATAVSLAVHNSSASAQFFGKQTVVIGQVVSVDKAAGTFTVDDRGKQVEISFSDRTKGADSITKGQNIVVMCQPSSDGKQYVALAVRSSPQGAKASLELIEKKMGLGEGLEGKRKAIQRKTIQGTGTGTDSYTANRAALVNAIDREAIAILEQEKIELDDGDRRSVVEAFSKGFDVRAKVIKESKGKGKTEVTIETAILTDRLAKQLRERQSAESQPGFDGDDFPSYQLTDYLKAESVGLPVLKKSGKGAPKATLTVKVSTDFQKWQPLAEEMIRKLRAAQPPGNVGFGKHRRFSRAKQLGAGVSQVPEVQLTQAQMKLKARGDESACMVVVLEKTGVSGSNRSYYWEGIEVRKEAFEIIANQYRDRRYFLKVTLKDARGNAVHEELVQLKHERGDDPLVGRWVSSADRPFTCVYIAPFLFSSKKTDPMDCMLEPYGAEVPVELAVSSANLKRVKDVTVEIVERDVSPDGSSN